MSRSLLLVALALAATSCGPTPAPADPPPVSETACTQDFECKSGMACSAGVCELKGGTSGPCTSSAACDTGYTCSPETRHCVSERVDAGTPDAGPVDAGRPDAGPVDAGTPDAGPADEDAGTEPPPPCIVEVCQLTADHISDCCARPAEPNAGLAICETGFTTEECEAYTAMSCPAIVQALGASCSPGG